MSFPFSSQLRRVNEVGHTRPTPSFGEGGLVWQVALWPGAGTEWHEMRKAFKVVPGVDSATRYLNARNEYIRRRDAFRQSINRLILALQLRGSWDPETAHVRFEWARNDKGEAKGYSFEWHNQPWFIDELAAAQQKNLPNAGADLPVAGDWFPTLEEESLAFTITWFPDSQPTRLHRGEGVEVAKNVEAAKKEVEAAKSDGRCARLRVHAEMYPEYATLAFYLEPEKSPEDGATLSRPQKIIKSINDAVRHFSDRADKRLEVTKSVNEPVIDNPEGTDKTHADVIFDKIWATVFADFGIDWGAHFANPKPGMRNHAYAFCSYRGVVIAVEGYGIGPGLRDPATVPPNRFEQPPQQKPGTQYADPGKADPEGRHWGTESLAMLKAQWPLISCLGDFPHNREFIASRVYSRRGLFVSPLGSVVQKADAGGGELQPMSHTRFVLFTKGPPNRRSCGRLVERLMSIMTLKAKALRDLGIINDSSDRAIARGQELDAIVDDWIAEKTTISNRLLQLEDEVQKLRVIEQQQTLYDLERAESGKTTLRGLGDRTWEDTRAAWLKLWKLENKITNESYKLSRHMIQADGLLGELAMEVGKIGYHTAGGLAYRLFKSQHYAEECLRLVDTLEIEPMDGWVSLEQNFQRGVEPIFDSVRMVRERIDSLRRRIQLVTAMVQTGAIFEQQRKTSENTDEIRKISRRNEVLQIQISANTDKISAYTISQTLAGWFGQIATLATGALAAEIYRTWGLPYAAGVAVIGLALVAMLLYALHRR